MVLLSFLILIFGQTVLISCGTLQSINGTEVKGIVGETLKLEWIVTAVGNENVDASTFMVCLHEDESGCIASGKPLKFSVDAGTAYTERIEAKYIDGKQVLKIIKLVKEDDGLKLYIKAVFRRTSTEVLDIKHDNVTIHVGAYPKLLQPLDSSLYFNENERPTVNITASGIPRPTVTWEFNDASSEESYTDFGNDTYTYKYSLPELTRNLCGYKLNYTISGWDNRIITKSSTVIVKFPHKVTVTRTNYTVVVSWGENNYGNCAPLFRIEVLNTTGHAVGSKTAATSPTCLTFDAKVGKKISKIRFNTSYHGIQSSMEENIPVLPTYCPTVTTKPTRNLSDASSDIGTIIGTLISGLIVGLILGSLATYAIIKRRIDERKGSTINNSNLRPNYEDIVEHGRRNDIIVSCTEMAGVTTSESNYTALDLSNVQSACYMEVNSPENKTYVNVQPQYEVFN